MGFAYFSILRVGLGVAMHWNGFGKIFRNDRVFEDVLNMP